LTTTIIPFTRLQLQRQRRGLVGYVICDCILCEKPMRSRWDLDRGVCLRCRGPRNAHLEYGSTARDG